MNQILINDIINVDKLYGVMKNIRLIIVLCAKKFIEIGMPCLFYSNCIQNMVQSASKYLYKLLWKI